MSFTKIGEHLLNVNEIVDIKYLGKASDFAGEFEGYSYLITFKNETEMYIKSYKNLDDILSDLNQFD